MSNYEQRINDATNKRPNELPGVREGEGVAEHAHPGTGFAGEEVGGAVGELEGAEAALGVRHHDCRASVGRGEAGESTDGSVGVPRVGLGRLAEVVDVADGGKAVTDKRRTGLAVEGGVSVAVRHRYRQPRAFHPLEEDGGGRHDFDGGVARLELFADVVNEVRPVFRARYEVLELRDHLAAVADAEREGLGTVEVLAEHLGELGRVEDARRPARSGAEDVAVGEAAAGDESAEVGEVDASLVEVGHVDVDGLEAGVLEGGGHFDVAVDALLAQDGDARRLADGHLWLFVGVEGDLEVHAGVGGVARDVVLLLRAGGVVADRLHLAGEL